MNRVFGVTFTSLLVGPILFAVVLLPGAAATAPPAAAAQAQLSLAGTTWRLVEFQSMDDAIGTQRPEDPSAYTMRLNGDGTATMRLDCNRATGTWSSAPGDDPASGRFTFGPLAVTRALCPPPSMGERIAADAQYVRSYLLREGKLYLSLMADAGIYVWEADAAASMQEVPAAPEDGGPRAFTVTGGPEVALRQDPSAAAAVVATYAPGTLLNNLGCRRAGQQVWCDVQEIGGGPRGFVAAALLEPAVSPDGTVATGPDDSALRAGQGDFDATGYIPCAQSPGQPMGQCPFSVARAGGGYATVVITRPDGGDRIIFFQLGRPIGFSFSQAEGAALEFGASRESDLNLVRIGPERYEIPDAVVLGG
jgi:heat shock protein HslJ